MLTGIHFLLTYACNFECDHCFLHCGPTAEGTFTFAQIEKILVDAKKIGTVEWIYFEGGEPFLYYPIMLAGMRRAREMGYKTGLVTNCYWATTAEDAGLWLDPLMTIGIDDLSLSDDAFHHGEVEETPAAKAAAEAARRGLPVSRICIEKPSVSNPEGERGKPLIGGGAVFRGRAAEKLTEGLPVRSPEMMRECLHEELIAPERVHVDAFGHVQVCQGISIGNLRRRAIYEIISEYDAATHPICGPLIQGGPFELARANNLEFQNGFVDECHFCYTVRRMLIDKYREYLAPRSVYGLA